MDAFLELEDVVKMMLDELRELDPTKYHQYKQMLLDLGMEVD